MESSGRFTLNEEYSIAQDKQARGLAPVAISIVLPVFNEEEVIQETINQLIQTLREIGSSFEILIVNDGSTDNTSEIIKSFSEDHYFFRIITSPYNKGNGFSVKTGIRAAQGEVIVCMDADGQHDPRDLVQMLPFMEEYDLVVGTRNQTYQGIWYRNLANRFYNALASWLTEFPIMDLTSGYRIFRANIIKKYVHLFPIRFSYPTTSTLVFLKSGHSVKYVPINFRSRQAGASKITILRDGWRFLIIIFKVIVLYEPLRIFLPISLLSFILALASTIYNVWLTHVFRITNTGVVLFVLGVLVLLLGLISEQITAIQVGLREDGN